MELQRLTYLAGQLFYASKETFSSLWKNLPEGERKEFLEACDKERIWNFVYYQFCRYGIELEGGRARYASCMIRAMQQQMELQKFCAKLDEWKIRYAMLKGTDLAFRIYPQAALRPYSDWDILFHYEDIRKALALLLEDGWHPTEKIPEGMPNHFHFPPMLKGKLFMEPHWTLPNFDNCPPELIWKHIHPVAPGAYRHILEPELNVLLLTRHSSEMVYQWCNCGKLLLDVAFLLEREPVDWAKSRELARELKQPYSGNLLAAFPDFFQPETIKAIEADESCVKAYWEILAANPALSSKSKEDWVLSEQRLTWAWLKQRLANCGFATTRTRHHLSADTNYFVVLGLTIGDFFMKCYRSLRYCLGDKTEVKTQRKWIEQAEKLEPEKKA